MEQRINPFETRYNALKPLFGFGVYLSKASIEKELLHLIYYRVSQLNGCAYCLDMHAKDLRVMGESEQRLYMLSAWEESPIYTERERAAFAWAEAVTNLADGHVKDAVYAQAGKQFSEAELIDLTIAIIAINGFNRLNVAFRTPAGNYVPGMHAHHVNNN
ncbi:carboxymuconolactone decarboxylase family protein [Flavobacterium beibuense]|uniref:Alkylhydroperoxidase-like protein n=1 Tax=Flavobacterium beibuense TaxID=657326 RepID=A0A444W9G2_9FLAO|nr:carboxymuconolactone decarboxylase family protein [Flavobacterium beibuense]RYJ42484.1 alkylhydroperoxidase-like protein [Flavobacterium beibuense]